MPSKKKKYNSKFPPARIKKIMQTDEEIGKVAAAVPVVISKCIEMFLESILKSAGSVTDGRKAKTMTTSHLKECIMNDKRLDFLHPLVVNEPDCEPVAEHGNEDGSSSSTISSSKEKIARKRALSRSISRTKRPKTSSEEEFPNINDETNMEVDEELLETDSSTPPPPPPYQSPSQQGVTVISSPNQNRFLEMQYPHEQASTSHNHQDDGERRRREKEVDEDDDDALHVVESPVKSLLTSAPRRRQSYAAASSSSSSSSISKTGCDAMDLTKGRRRNCKSFDQEVFAPPVVSHRYSHDNDPVLSATAPDYHTADIYPKRSSFVIPPTLPPSSFVSGPPPSLVGIPAPPPPSSARKLINEDEDDDYDV